MGAGGVFRAELWLADATGAWHFVSLPNDLADEIADAADSAKPGFGSVRVAVRIGATAWRTSIFPDTKRGTYVLPVKKAVRAAEGVAAGDEVTVDLRVVD